jgi:hypothetical protein
VVHVILWSAGLPVAQAGSDFETKAARYFTVKCSTILYQKMIQIGDLDTPPAKFEVAENLSLYCKIEIRDPNLVLGTHQEGVVTQVTSSRGQDVNIVPGIAPGQVSLERFYDSPWYQGRFVPPAEPRWRQWARSILRLAPDFLPQWVVELQPSRMNLGLDLRILAPTGRELPRLQGYFYALVAEKVEQVDVPCEPNGPWVRLMPDLEVRVRPTSSAGPLYDFRIETRPPEGPLHPLAIGAPLPDRLVSNVQFLAEDGQPTPCTTGGPMYVREQIGGDCLGRVPQGRIKALRFLIAVHSTHCRIPFELQHIPLPDPNQSVPRQKGSP